MTPRRFHSFMVDIEIGGNAKVGRLNDTEFRCLVTGIWPLAAKANPRGYLQVGALPAEPEDVARQARCSLTVARKTLEKMRALGMLESVEGREWVHDWNDHQPNPRKPSDDPAATRERKRRSRVTGSVVTPPSHAESRVTSRDPSRARSREVEVEGKEQQGEPSVPLVATVRAAIVILEQSDRLHIDEVGVENAIASWPHHDPLRAAHTVITWVSDPAFQNTNGARLLERALSKQSSDAVASKAAEVRAAGQREHPVDTQDRELAEMAERLRREERVA